MAECSIFRYYCTVLHRSYVSARSSVLLYPVVSCCILLCLLRNTLIYVRIGRSVWFYSPSCKQAINSRPAINKTTTNNNTLFEDTVMCNRTLKWLHVFLYGNVSYFWPPPSIHPSVHQTCLPFLLYLLLRCCL